MFVCLCVMFMQATFPLMDQLHILHNHRSWTLRVANGYIDYNPTTTTTQFIDEIEPNTQDTDIPRRTVYVGL